MYFEIFSYHVYLWKENKLNYDKSIWVPDPSTFSHIGDIEKRGKICWYNVVL